MTEKTISEVNVFPGSAETLVRRGGITNHRLIAYSLSTIFAKNYRNRLLNVKVIVCNISVVFFETQCITSALQAVRLSWLENEYTRPLFRRAILTRNVGQTDLVSGVRSGFISRSVHERLQVSVCSGYDLCQPG